MSGALVAAMGLRERALVAFDEAERRRERERLAGRRRIEDRTRFETETLLAAWLRSPIEAPDGEVVLDGLRLGARPQRLNGHYVWVLCLLETCVVCLDDVETPLVGDPYDVLGRVLAARERTPPHHPPERQCWVRGAGR